MEKNFDYIIPDFIDDTIQVLKFSNNRIQPTNFLASGGWDNKIRVWEINYNPIGNNNEITCQFNSKLHFTDEFPESILSLCWQTDTYNLFSSQADGTITIHDLINNQKRIIGKHDLGVKEIIYIDQYKCLISGGWDGKLCVWDINSQTQKPILSYDLGKRVFSMSCVFPLLVIGLSERGITYFNLNKIQSGLFKPECIFESHLKYQTRAISVFSEGNGYAIGSIEGRVAVKHVDLNKASEINQENKTMNSKDDFAFRCHRTGEDLQDVFPVNSIAFNAAYGTFCTGGGDGTWVIWDRSSRSRLKLGCFPQQQNQNKIPITALDYSLNGDLLAYAGGYDWSKGISGENSSPNKIGIHYCLDSEKKSKGK
jgi:mRNA export factor